MTGEGLKHLSALTDLTTLDLGGTDVADAALLNLQNLRQLTTLSLARTRVANAGIGLLAPLTGLQNLNLSCLVIDDGRCDDGDKTAGN